ncbi:MAG: hypothetical protein MUC55_06055 [Burkholderiales bacterium]|jgi:DNA-binding IclR family transcriptional regulator|nr:hypothetical protein [Burkholderiales bacterium]
MVERFPPPFFEDIVFPLGPGLLASAQERARLEALPGPAGFDAHPIAITVLMASYNLRRLNALHRVFEGDFSMPVIVAEAGLHAVRRRLVRGLDGESGKDDHGVRIGELSAAIELPRETVRRKTERLVSMGWLSRAPNEVVKPTERTLRLFDVGERSDVVADFMWTVSRLRELLGVDTARASHDQARRDGVAALATRVEDLPEGVLDAVRDGASRLLVDAARGDLAVLAIGGYLLRHLLRLNTAFEGDLLLPLLLGEVSHFNLRAALYRHPVTTATFDETVARLLAAEASPATLFAMRPCNAHSIATATGIPGSTVRRKLARLAARGWIVQTESGAYLVSATASRDFGALNNGTLHDLLATGERLRAILAG